MTDTTRELAFGCENMGYSREETVDRITKAVLDLELSDYLNRSIFELSSGEKQQIAIGSVYALCLKYISLMNRQRIWTMLLQNVWQKP